MAEAIERLFVDRVSIERNARVRVEKDFGWDRIAAVQSVSLSRVDRSTLETPPDIGCM